jgi:hypothetical protein
VLSTEIQNVKQKVSMEEFLIEKRKKEQEQKAAQEA